MYQCEILKDNNYITLIPQTSINKQHFHANPIKKANDYKKPQFEQ